MRLHQQDHSMGLFCVALAGALQQGNCLARRRNSRLLACQVQSGHQWLSYALLVPPSVDILLNSQRTRYCSMGHFQQLRQITAGIRFKPGMKIQVVGMFDWDERTLHVELLAKKTQQVHHLSSRRSIEWVLLLRETLWFDAGIGIGQESFIECGV